MIECFTGEGMIFDRPDSPLAGRRISIDDHEAPGGEGKGMECNPSITARQLSIGLSLRGNPSHTV